ncbi:PIN domain-containing protein [Kitasatospora sp. NPDC036755]|uniref:PIN domain-containing protein n=1 Tax=Kitasatospora sp. NPDC036755 TaxID=3154600 RepID=UPI0033FB09BD
MIIFDTNAVRLLNPASDKADLIRKLRASGQDVGVPSMVLVELAAQQVLRYRDAYKTVESAISNLQAVTPDPLGKQTVPDSQHDAIDTYWTKQYSDLFRVVETTPEMAMAALSREAHGLKPAKRDRNDKHGDTKTGARDVAIWLTVIKYMQDHPSEQVYFVTANSSDFGDGSSFEYPMNDDARELKDRLVLLSGWDDVVERFTNKVSATVDDEDLLRSDRLARVIQIEAKERLRDFYGLASWLPGSGASVVEPDSPAHMEAWVAPPFVELVGVEEISGHEIGGAVWYTANTTWLVSGIALNTSPGVKFAQLSVKWSTKILFSTSVHPPVVISSAEPALPDFREGSPDFAARQRLATKLMTTEIPTEELLSTLERFLVQTAGPARLRGAGTLRQLRNHMLHGQWHGGALPGDDIDTTPGPQV